MALQLYLNVAAYISSGPSSLELFSNSSKSQNPTDAREGEGYIDKLSSQVDIIFLPKGGSYLELGMIWVVWKVFGWLVMRHRYDCSCWRLLCSWVPSCGSCSFGGFCNMGVDGFTWSSSSSSSSMEACGATATAGLVFSPALASCLGLF